MTRSLRPEPLTAAAFAPFGQVLEATGTPDKLINLGRCGRFHDLAGLDIVDGTAGISLFRSELSALPFTLDLMERHPLGSQAFLPMSRHGFMVTVAGDENGAPGTPRAFLTSPEQGVNIGRNVWHGVLTPLAGSGLFAVVDRIGEGSNLEEYRFDRAWTVEEN